MPNSSENSRKKESYSLISTRSYFEELRKLDRIANQRIMQTVELLGDNPRLGKMLRGQLEGLWSLRVGELRMIYSIKQSSRTVAPRAVSHRGEVYTR